MLGLAVVAGALLLSLGSAAPPRAPARGGIKLSSCPKGGSSLAAAHDDSEAAGIETFARDYEITTSYENGSTCGAQAGENGLDGAFPRRALASADAATKSWLQLYKSSGAGDAFDSEPIKGAASAELDPNKYQAGGAHALHAIEQTVGSDVQYKNYRSDGTILLLAAPTKGGVDVLDVASAELAPTPGTTMQFMAPDATKGGVDEEEAAQSYLGRTSWCLFQVLASVVPRRSSSAMGAAWRSSVVGYLLIWGDATRVAAETSVRGLSGRGDDNTKSKTMTRTNNPPRAPAGGLAQRRALTGYAMDDDSIRTAVAAWFADQSAAEAVYGHISTWDTSGVTDMEFLFSACDWDSRCNSAAAAFNQDIGGWAVHNVRYMSFMFMGASAFNQDLSSWETSAITNMFQMFGGASSFNQDISGWRVDSVTDMSHMFSGASVFDQDLGWCVDDGANLDYAFTGTPCESTSCGVVLQGVDCPFPTPAPTQRNFMDDSRIRTAVRAWMEDRAAAEATYGHISTWDTSGVTDMSRLFCVWQDWMEAESWYDDICFSASSFNEDIGAWDISGVTVMDYMFYYAAAFNRDIGGWAVHSVTDMSGMFNQASAFDQDISAWSVDNVRDMHQMFNSASSFNQNIGGWSVGQVTNMHWMFGHASSFNQDISAWNVENVRDMHYMFHYASAFDQDLNWCVDNDVNLDEAFSGTPCASTSCGIVRGRSEGGICVTLAPTFFDGAFGDESIRTAVRAWMEDRAAAEATYGHISTWETSGVTDMSLLFCANSWYCSTYYNSAAESFNEDIGPWDTSGVTTMEWMFYKASAFDQDIGAWDTSGVTSMHGMFWYASSFNQNIGGWSVENVYEMSQMFRRASSFNQNIGAWSVDNVRGMHRMFFKASAFDQDLSGWAVQSVEDMYQMFGGASAFDQDLGWCVGNDVNLGEAFDGSGCCSTSCGVAQKDETGNCQIKRKSGCEGDDDDEATELVMSTGLAAIGITFTGITIAAIANAVQEQCALGPTIVYEAGTTHPYYISPNLCSIGTKTYASKKTVRDASPRKVCRKFCEAASEKGKLVLKHVQGLTCYCKRR